MSSKQSDAAAPKKESSIDSLISGSSVRTLRGLAAIIAPTSLITALIYYFGWVRTSIQATYMGLDDSLFGYSTTDYLLLGAPSMFWPIVFGLLVGLGLLLMHGAIRVWLRPSEEEDGVLAPARRRRLKRLIGLICLIGVISLVLGLVGASSRAPTRFFVWAGPVGLGFGVVLAAYAIYLYLSFLGPGPYGGLSDEFKALRFAGPGLVMLLLFLMLFWGISHYFALTGIDLADQVEAQLASQPSVVIYSPTRLQLGPPVVQTELDGEESQYKFAYSGLKLLFRAEGQLFLRPSDPNSDANIVIPENDSLRFEFIKGDF